MRMRSVSVLLCSTLLAPFASAQGGTNNNSYQWELNASYGVEDADTTATFKTTELMLEATFNFKPVELKDQPWLEADFLERVMQVGVVVDQYTQEVGNAEPDGLLYGARFRYADKESPVAAEIRYAVGNIDGDGFDVDLSALSALVGYWVEDGFLVGLDLSLETMSPSGGSDMDQTKYGLFAKNVRKLDGGRAVNLEGSIRIANFDDGSTDDSNTEIQIGGDYFFTPQYSAGAELGYFFGDARSEEGTSFVIRGEAFFTQNIAVGASYGWFWADDSQFGADADLFSINVRGRF